MSVHLHACVCVRVYVRAYAYVSEWVYICEQVLFSVSECVLVSNILYVCM